MKFQKITVKKRIKSKYGEISVSKESEYLSSFGSSKISPYLKEKLVYIGQLDCYERGAEIAEYLMNVKTNDTAIYRLTDKVGKECELVVESESTREAIELSTEENLYVQCDGSMLLTREEGWKEIKLGRLFKSSSILPENINRQWIMKSEYVAHFGSHYEFENKMSKIIDDVYRKHSDKIIFIGDGAKWQWNWVKAEYPKAICILDFYHAMEHFGNYIKIGVRGKAKVEDYMQKTGKILKNKGVQRAIEYVMKIPCDTEMKQKEKEKLMTYLENNKDKMDYPNYLKKKYIIGSGAIESAHRTVLQRRMKQSGQRWSINGLKNMINIRVLKMSGYWHKVEETICKNAA